MASEGFIIKSRLERPKLQHMDHLYLNDSIFA